MTDTFTEEDIRPSGLMAEKEQYELIDRTFLLSHKDEWVLVSCPACGKEETSVFGIKNEIKYVICDYCETVYINPRPSQELLHKFNTLSKGYTYWNKHIFPITEGVRTEKIYRPRAQRLVEYLKKYNRPVNGVFLEIGAGFGSFCQELTRLQQFERIIAIEPFPEFAETCRSKQLEVIQLPIEKIQEREIADVIAAFEVIEHLFNPASFLENCYRLLKPDGLLYLSCPNVKGFDVSTLGLVSATFGEGHLNYYHPSSLSLLFERQGFEVMDIATPGKLDCEIVRNQILNGTLELENQPFLQEVFINRWEKLGQPFQTFLSDNRLSSHMVIIGRKIPPA